MPPRRAQRRSAARATAAFRLNERLIPGLVDRARQTLALSQASVTVGVSETGVPTACPGPPTHSIGGRVSRATVTATTPVPALVIRDKDLPCLQRRPSAFRLHSSSFGR